MPTLVYCDVDGVDRSFELGAAPILVGRAAECTIRSDDPRMSRQHARFFLDNGHCWVEDLGSANGVWVGPQRVGRAVVPVGEVVVVGSLLVQLVDPMRPVEAQPGVHSQLSQWLAMERKTRQALEDERNAFATRVGELHEKIAAAPAADELAGLMREREAARARASELEQGLAEAQQALAGLRGQVDQLRAEHDRLVEDADRTSNDMSGLQQAMLRLDQLTTDHDRMVGEVEAARAERDDAIARLRATGDELAALAAAQRAAEQRHDAERAAAEKKLAGLEQQVQMANESLLVAEATAGVFAAEKLADADRRVAQLEERIAALTAELRAAREAGANEAAQAAAAEAAKKIGDAEARAEEAGQRAADAAGKLAAAEKQAGEAAARAAALEKDLAFAREREAKAKELEKAGGDAAALAAAKLAEAEARAAEAAARAAELEAQRLAAQARIEELTPKLDAADLALGKASALERQLDEALYKLTHAEAAGGTAAAQAAAEAAKKIADADSRTAAAEQALEAARQRAAELEGSLGAEVDRTSTLELEMDTLRERITTLEEQRADVEQELARARDAAEQLRGRLAQVDAEAAEADRLRDRIERLEEDLGAARAEVAAAKSAPPPAAPAAPGLPAGVADLLASLTDSVTSLRASMRAASDETAVMEQTESVQVITGAITSATEDIERARDALRALGELVPG